MYAKIYQDIQNRRKNSQYRKKQAEARLAQSSKKVETAVVTIENGTNGMEMQVVKKTTVNNPGIVNGEFSLFCSETLKNVFFTGTDQQQPIEEVAKLMDDETAATKESKTTKAESKVSNLSILSFW